MRTLSGILLALCLVAGTPSASASAVAEAMEPGSRAEAKKDTLRIWVPQLYPTQITANKFRPFLKRLSRELDMRVRLESYKNADELLQRCSIGHVDHALLGKNAAEVLIQQCGFVTIAKSTQSNFLYTPKRSGKHHVSELRRVAVYAASRGRELIAEELPGGGRNFTLVEYPSILTALTDLMSGKVDAMVSLEGPINNLDPRLVRKLRILHAFQAETSAYFIASPALPAATLAKMRALYLSDDPVMHEVFQVRFKLGPFTAVPPAAELATPADNASLEQADTEP